MKKKNLLIVAIMFFTFSLKCLSMEKLVCKFETNNCHHFFLVSPPNMLDSNLLVIFADDKNVLAEVMPDRNTTVVGSAVFPQNMIAVGQSCGIISVFSLNEGSRQDFTLDLEEPIQGLCAFDEESIILAPFGELTIIKLSEVRQDPDRPCTNVRGRKWQIKPGTLRNAANIVYAQSYDNPSQLLFLTTKQDQVKHGVCENIDFTMDNKGNIYEISCSEGLIISNSNDEKAKLYHGKKDEMYRFVENFSSSDKISFLCTRHNKVMICSMEKISEQQTWELWIELPDFDLPRFEEYHDPKKIMRVVNFDNQLFIIWDGDKLTLWTKEQNSSPLEIMNGYEILNQHRLNKMR